jgi:hypothetical protein
MKSVMKNLTARRNSAAAIVVVIVGALAATAAFAIAGGNKHQLPPPAHRVIHRAAVASSVSAAIASDFPLLSRTATASDKLPAGATATDVWFPEQRVGANAALAKLAASSSDSATYLIPGQASVCVQNTSSAENFCASADEVQAGDAQEITLCSPSVPSADIQLSGLLPSAASNVRMALGDGALIPVMVENGTYAVRFSRSGSLPVSISWSIAGARQTATVSVPARASSEDCEPTQ